jgi:hypothetical protein
MLRSGLSEVPALALPTGSSQSLCAASVAAIEASHVVVAQGTFLPRRRDDIVHGLPDPLDSLLCHHITRELTFRQAAFLLALPELTQAYRGWPRMLTWLQALLEKGETVEQRKPASWS